MVGWLASFSVRIALFALIYCVICSPQLGHPQMVTAQTRLNPSAAILPQRAPPELSSKVLRFNEAKRAANEGVVSITASGRTTAYSQFAEDIRNVIESLPDNNTRIIPILGKSSGQNLLDLLYLRGIDMGVVDQDVLQYFKRQDPQFYGDLDKRVNFVAKLFNTEFHLFAHKDIKSLEDLRGKEVSCLAKMSTAATLCENIFLLLKIDVKISYDDVELALLKLKKGEIAAAARAGSVPVPGFSGITAADNLHFVPIDEESLPNSQFHPIRAAYMPSRLKSEDYPNMIPAGESVPTVATSTILAVYGWPSDSPQYREISQFIEVFFNNIDKFRQPPRHPKWRDVNLAADVPGWKRFPAAQAWLDSRRVDTSEPTASTGPADGRMKSAFDKFVADFMKSDGNNKAFTTQQKEAVYVQFLQWWETVGKNKKRQE